jgi:YD repeat-containing protein
VVIEGSRDDSSSTGFAATINVLRLVNQIPHVNGMTVTQANDPNAMMRPASITATVGAATPWGSGTYTYDGVGNVKAIGSNYYRYDHVSRLMEGTAQYVSGSNHKRQTYTYDTYGNMKTITTIENGSTAYTETLVPGASTNRLMNLGDDVRRVGEHDGLGQHGQCDMVLHIRRARHDAIAQQRQPDRSARLYGRRRA